MRFLLADDHSIVRMYLKLMLEDDYADVTIKETENGNEIVKKRCTNRQYGRDSI